MTGFVPTDRAAGLFTKENKALGDTQYIFHPLLHEVLSQAIVNFDLHILSKEQEKLITRYFGLGDDIAAGTCTDAEILQLDIYLGGLTNELCNERKYTGSLFNDSRTCSSTL